MTATTNQVAKASKAICGAVAIKKPNVEATPLPPLNFNQIGKLWPKTPQVPASKEATIF